VAEDARCVGLPGLMRRAPVVGVSRATLIAVELEQGLDRVGPVELLDDGRAFAHRRLGSPFLGFLAYPLALAFVCLPAPSDLGHVFGDRAGVDREPGRVRATGRAREIERYAVLAAQRVARLRVRLG